MHSPESQLKADLLLLSVTLLAAAGWIFSKEALAGLPPLLFIGGRFLLAGLILGMAGAQALRQSNRQGLLRSAAVGLLFAGAMAFWIMGLRHGTHIGEGAFITSLGLVLVPLMARWIFRDTLPPNTWIALPVALSGLACLSLDQGFRFEAGQIYYLISAVMFALSFNLNSRIVAQVPAVALSAIQLTVVGILSLTLSGLFETWPQQVSPEIWTWLLASVVLATCLRFFLQILAQGLTPASHAAVIMMLEPIWTALLASIWFDEAMSRTQFLGCTLIFSALVINRWTWVQRMLRRLAS